MQKIITVILILTMLGCDSSKQDSYAKSELVKLYEHNEWEYPIEISDTLFPAKRNEPNNKRLIAPDIKNQLFQWANQSLSKDSLHEALKISASSFYTNPNNDSLMICEVLYYVEKNKKDIGPGPSKYTLIEGKFYYIIGNPVFKIVRGELIFLGFPDYLDMEMLPNSD